MHFFANKILKIHSAFETCNTFVSASISLPDHRMTYFNKVSVDDIKKLIKESKTKSCSLDPLPTFLLKECIDYLALIITAIINSSISHCQVPSAFKSAVVTPQLKKSSFPQDDLSNYRPVSNLPFVSKLLEKTIGRQLADHKTKHSLYGKYQSVYRAGHSTNCSYQSLE